MSKVDKFHHPNCSLGATNGPGGDFCNCSMAVSYPAYATLRARVAELENELCTAKDQIPPDMESDSLSVALIKLKDQLAAMTKERDVWQVKYTTSKRIQRDVEKGEFWHWNDDEHDHLDSLICPVVVQPEKIKEWKQQLAASQARVKELELDVTHRDRTIQEHIAKQGELQDARATVTAERDAAEKIVRDLCEKFSVHHPDCIPIPLPKESR